MYDQGRSPQEVELDISDERLKLSLPGTYYLDLCFLDETGSKAPSAGADTEQLEAGAGTSASRAPLQRGGRLIESGSARARFVKKTQVLIVNGPVKPPNVIRY